MGSEYNSSTEEEEPEDEEENEDEMSHASDDEIDDVEGEIGGDVQDDDSVNKPKMKEATFALDLDDKRIINDNDQGQDKQIQSIEHSMKGSQQEDKKMNRTPTRTVHSQSRMSNYTSFTNKPLPFNAVRYIAMSLKGHKPVEEEDY